MGAAAGGKARRERAARGAAVLSADARSFPGPAGGGAASNLVPAAASAAAGALELAGLGGVAGVGLGGAVGHAGGAAEVLVHLARLERPAEEHAVGAGRRAKGELVKGDDLAAGGDDAGAGGVGGAEGGYGELQVDAVEQADIVGDGAHNDSNLAGLAIHLLGELSDGDWGPIGAAHEQALEDNRIEFTFSAASQESIKLWK